MFVGVGVAGALRHRSSFGTLTVLAAMTVPFSTVHTVTVYWTSGERPRKETCSGLREELSELSELSALRSTALDTGGVLPSDSVTETS